MEHVISDVIIGVIILSLLLVVIPIYRNQTEQMANVVEITDQNEKIREVIFRDLPQESNIVSGRYIKELIYYYISNQEEFSVIIQKSGTIYFFTESTYGANMPILDENYMFFIVNTAQPEENYFVLEYREEINS